MLAPAKVSLFLHVVGKRADGYHLLQSLVMFADVGDDISLVAADNFSLKVMGDYAATLAPENPLDNLVAKAAFALARFANIPCNVAIALDKKLPIGAGLGGGSADAAAVLHALNDHWHLGNSLEKLATIGANLGADIPACVYNSPLLMEGIGENITPISMAFDVPILLVNPRVHVATPDVFRQFSGEFNAPISLPSAFANVDALLAYLENTHNALQAPAIAVAPAIAALIEALQQLPAATIVRMSGSGATCFALFETVAACKKAAEIIRAKHPDYWVQAANLKGNEQHG